MSTAGGILFFLSLNDRGGAEISMIRLAQGLADAGRSVTLAIYGHKPDLARELGFKGDVIDLHSLRTLHATWALFRLLRSGHFPTVISALTHTNIAAIAAACLSRRNVRVVVTEHGGEKVYATWHALVTSACLAYRRAACVVAVSGALAHYWRSVLSPRTSVTTIYNPVVADHALPVTPTPHPWLAQKNIPVIMGIGRLKPEKNFLLLIDAFARFAQKREARLIILGEGEQRPLLEQRVREWGLNEKILLPGFIADPQTWLAHATLFVSASHREGFGNVIVEALACGVPVVATDCPFGPSEILGQGRYGRLVPVNDAAIMALAIAETLEQQPDQTLLRARAADFTVARCIAGYEGLIDSLSPARVP